MDKLSRFLLTAGLVIVITGISLGIFTGNKVVEMNGPNGMDKIAVRVKNNPQKAVFTMNDIADIKNQLGIKELAISSTVESGVRYENRTTYAKIRGVNYIYGNFNDIGIKFGNFFSAKNELRSDPVIVIDLELALNLFNTDDVVGKKVSLLGREFTVIGTFQPHGSLDKDGTADKNILERYTDDGIPVAYMPIEVLMDAASVPGIEFVQIHIGRQGTLGENIDKVENALESVGKRTYDYEITDFNQKQALLKQLPRLCIFLIGCFPVLLLFRRCRTELTVFYRIIREQLGKDYWTAVIKKNLADLVKIILLVLGSCIFMFIMWKTVRFDLYVPPEYIAEELTDARYYSDLFKDKMIQSNQDASLILDPSEELMQAGIKANILIACIVILIGIPLLYFGIRLSASDKGSGWKQAAYCGGSIVAALMFTAWASWYLGMTFVMDVRLLAVSSTYVISVILDGRYRSILIEKRSVLL